MELEAKGLFFSYSPDKPVLQDISFHLEPGELLFVLGRNGSGKTTLLSCLNGIFTPSAGEVILDGKDIASYRAVDRARRIGLIPQLHTPTFAYSVREIVLMGRSPHLSLFGAPGLEDMAIVDEALETVGLVDLQHRPYTQLSGGEQQLVLIARGLAQKCNILLMDEPSAHLDLSNQYQVLEMIDQLAKQGLSFIISSHSPNNALAYAKRVLLLQNGRVMAYGELEETLTEPLLSAAYGLKTEVIYKKENGTATPQAILPRRPLAISPASMADPDSDLSCILERSCDTPQLVVVTGLSGAGKTTWCREMVKHAKAKGLTVGGLLSPAVFEEGRKTGIDLIDLVSGEQRPLAKLRGETVSGVGTAQWDLDPEVIAWGDAILTEQPDCDILVLDELGPLEFFRKEGFLSGLALIDQKQFRAAFVVVRSSLLPFAQQRWPYAHIVTA
ncbi:MAG: ATP-binding cassette domain-containing protein [Anaerolineales bacterium]|nr:ATP-binding cassette domain-containing protein [Anaerolineales bacterium]